MYNVCFVYDKDNWTEWFFSSATHIYIHTYVYAHTGSTVIVGENINGGGGDKGVDFFSVSALLLVYVCMSSLADICSGEIWGAGAIRSGITAKLLALNMSSRIDPVVVAKNIVCIYVYARFLNMILLLTTSRKRVSRRHHELNTVFAFL